MGGGSSEKILMKQIERHFLFWKEEILNGFLCGVTEEQTLGKQTSACTQSVQGEIVARR